MKSGMYILLYLISNALRSYALHMLYDTFFEKKKIKTTYVGFIIFYLTISLEYLCIDLPILTFALNCIGLFLLALLYHSSITSSVIATIFALTLASFSEAIIMLFSGYTRFSFMQNGFYSSYIGVSAIAPLLFLFCLFYRRMKRGNASHTIPLSHSIVTLTIPAACLFIIFQIFTFEGVADWQFLSIILLLLFLSFGTIWLYDRQLVAHEKEEQQQLLTIQNESLHNEIERMTLLGETTRQIQHDLKNYLLAINILAKNNEDTAVTNYIEPLLFNLQLDENHVQTGNLFINGICNYYISIARQYSIPITYEIDVPEQITFDENDMTILLGNLWNNCIENAKTAQSPELVFHLKYNKNRFFLTSKNTYSGARIQFNNTFLSTKKNAHLHGIGLKNMEQIISKYNGLMEIKCDETYFQVNIMINLD